uniref:Heat shock protein family B (small) member 7 n=1 Tax=Podarcis muralis TaxID=64176 RepID=A0A670J0K7_PODMU
MPPAEAHSGRPGARKRPGVALARDPSERAGKGNLKWAKDARWGGSGTASPNAHGVPFHLPPPLQGCKAGRSCTAGRAGGMGNIKTLGDTYQFAVDVSDFSPEDIIITTSKNQIEVHAEKLAADGTIMNTFTRVRGGWLVLKGERRGWAHHAPPLWPFSFVYNRLPLVCYKLLGIPVAGVTPAFSLVGDCFFSEKFFSLREGGSSRSSLHVWES